MSRTPVVESRGVLTAEYGPGAVYGPRTLRDFEFVWLLDGSATWRVHNVDSRPGKPVVHHLRPGIIALSQSGQRDEYSWDSVKTSHHSYVHFRLLESDGLPAQGQWPAVRRMSDSVALEGLTGYLVELSWQAGDGARARCDQVLGLLLDVFVTGPFLHGDGAMPEAMAIVVEYLERVWSVDSMRSIPVPELSQAMHCSPRHLFRLFEQNYSLGPARVLELLRLARAAVLLQRSNLTIADIAERTGFANPYHFSNRFARTYGQPPGAFRAQPDVPDPLGPLRLPRLLRLAQQVLAALPAA